MHDELMNDECSINLSFSVHDNVTWQITMNYDKINDKLWFIICHFISHSEIICHVTLSCTENYKLIEHSSFINSSCNF